MLRRWVNLALFSTRNHGIKAMNGALRDESGGWYACVNERGRGGCLQTGLSTLLSALLGAASTVTTGSGSAQAASITPFKPEKYFWSEEEQMSAIAGRSLQQNRRVPRRQCQYPRGGSFLDCL
ncbi:AGE family epimerase/isomerase [Escherichia coli]